MNHVRDPHSVQLRNIKHVHQFIRKRHSLRQWKTLFKEKRKSASEGKEPRNRECRTEPESLQPLLRVLLQWFNFSQNVTALVESGILGCLLRAAVLEEACLSSSQSSNHQPSVCHTDEPQLGRNSYLWLFLFFLCWMTGGGDHWLPTQ